MNGFNDDSALVTIKYPYQVCGIFKVPASATPDNIVYQGTND